MDFNLIAEILLALIVVAEIVVRFTPTEKDDGFVEMIGKFIKQLLTSLGLPNKKKEKDETAKMD